MMDSTGKKTRKTHQTKNQNDIFLSELTASVKKSAISSPYSFAINRQQISEKIKETKEDIENKGLNLDITLKKWTLIALFAFLAIETLLIFLFTFFQGVAEINFWFFEFKFHLEEWSFRLLIFATISQITAMLIIAVKHLFPSKHK